MEGVLFSKHLEKADFVLDALLHELQVTSALYFALVDLHVV